MDRTAQAALTSIEARQDHDAQSTGVQLLTDVRNVVSESSRPEWSSTNLYNAVVHNEETDWSAFNHGRPITKKKFTQMFDFGIKPTKRSNANVFYVADLEDAFTPSNAHLEISSGILHMFHRWRVWKVEGLKI